MNPRDDVIISYSSIAPESTSTGQVCPKCRGGRGQERSLSVGRTGAFLWWRCHRASCAFVGKHTLNSDGPTTFEEKNRGGHERQFKRQALPGKLITMFYEQNRLTPETLEQARWSYTPNYDGYGPRVIMPIFSPDGRVRGESFRSYDGHRKKALINGQLAENMISWYRWKKYGKLLLIVEDPVSAVRLAQAGVDSLSLMGTMMSVDRALEIREQEYNRVVLSLDNDASAQAIKYVHEYRRYIPNFYVALLDKDIKNMTEQELDIYINTS